MALVLETTPIPLITDAQGVVRVRGSRVTLATIVAAFEQGATAEAIVEQFPTLDLADVYGVISYYLHHREAVRAYLAEHEARAAAVRQLVEQRSPQADLRERLLARRAHRADQP